ncbi:MAG: hypothetical protein R3F19_24520 [Verrucomicrobiales bacterium]|nr:hypothetical protein [Verrucomicrobiae bacterium]
MHDELILALATLPESELQQLAFVQKGSDPDLDYLMSQFGDHRHSGRPLIEDTQSSAHGG